MNLKEAAQYSVEKLKSLGADKAQVSAGQQSFDEVQYDNDDFTLMRSVEEYSLSLQVIKDQKEGSYDVNKLDKDEIDRACEVALKMADSGQADESFDIAPNYAAKSFSHGPESAEPEKMYDMIGEFVEESNSKYSKIGIRSSNVNFHENRSFLFNSNGSEAEVTNNYYYFTALFSGRDGDKSSSMNYDGFAFQNFDKKALERASMDRAIRESVEHLNTKKVPKTFTGPIVISPQCLIGFISMMLGHLQSTRLIAKTSRLQGKIGEKVASEKFTLKSLPQSKDFAIPNFLTTDGIETEDITIFDEGVLKTYLLSLYGANKLGEKRPTNFDSRLYMPKGDLSFDEMVSQIDQGIVINRFSGGSPAANGDLSGIAKNSFYIEGGKVQHALSETMISGNLFDMFGSLWATSSEVYENGTCHLPYVAVKDVTVS